MVAKTRTRLIVDITLKDKDIKRLISGYVVYKTHNSTKYAIKKVNPFTKEIKALEKKLKQLRREGK